MLHYFVASKVYNILHNALEYMYPFEEFCDSNVIFWLYKFLWVINQAASLELVVLGLVTR